MKSLPAKRVYEVWLDVIRDEVLYEAVLAGTHGQLGRDLDAETTEILDQFHAQAIGTKWNVENLRFRSALEVGGVLINYLPRTMYLLTRNDEDWRQDMAFDYLAHYKWTSFGHRQLTECERFGEYVRARVVKRRMTSPHLEAVLTYELAMVRLLRMTADVPADAWPNLKHLAGRELSALKPRRSPVQVIVDLAEDIRPWIESGNPAVGEVGPDPVTVLLHIPSLEESHRLKTISDGVRVVLDSCDGERTVDEIGRQLEEEYGLPQEAVQGLVKTLLDERILCA